jgi:hypothetical protein
MDGTMRNNLSARTFLACSNRQMSEAEGCGRHTRIADSLGQEHNPASAGRCGHQGSRVGTFRQPAIPVLVYLQIGTDETQFL